MFDDIARELLLIHCGSEIVFHVIATLGSNPGQVRPRWRVDPGRNQKPGNRQLRDRCDLDKDIEAATQSHAIGADWRCGEPYDYRVGVRGNDIDVRPSPDMMRFINYQKIGSRHFQLSAADCSRVKSLHRRDLNRHVRPGVMACLNYAGINARVEELRRRLLDQLAAMRQKQHPLPSRDGIGDHRRGKHGFAGASRCDQEHAPISALRFGADAGDGFTLICPEIEVCGALCRFGGGDINGSLLLFDIRPVRGANRGRFSIIWRHRGAALQAGPTTA